MNGYTVIFGLGVTVIVGGVIVYAIHERYGAKAEGEVKLGDKVVKGKLNLVPSTATV